MSPSPEPGPPAGATAAQLERAARLEPYFDLQLRFAARLSLLAPLPLPEAVTFYTNLHRRFGLGKVGRGGGTDPAWLHYLQGLEAQEDHAARLRWTRECFERAGPERAPPGQHRFGCFACEKPDGDGVVRIHFGNHDDDGTSPLAPGKQARRRAELAELFTFVAHRFDDARSVRGTSWLYHLEAYRRLFPPEYVASRGADTGARDASARPLYFHGSSSWGQFIDHRERIKPGPAARFVAALPALDPDRLREAFPLPALLVTAPVDVFYRHYGAG